MTTHWFQNALKKALEAYIVTGATIKVLLVMTNTTVDTVLDAMNFVSDFATLDECDGANYARKTLSNGAVNVDDGNDRAEYTSDPVTFSSLGAGTRQTQGALFFKFVTNDADSIPLFYLEFASPVTHNGTDFVLTPNSEGWAYNQVG